MATELNPTQTATSNPGTLNSVGMQLDTSGTTSASGGSGSSSSSLFSDLTGGISSFLNSPTGNVAEFGALAGLGLSQAGTAQKQAASAAGQLTGAGASFSATGTGILGEFNASQPASAGQQTTAAAGLGDIANTSISNYKSGTLSPADEARLQAQITQQKQQVAQQLANSGGTDQSALDTAYQQIDSNAMMNRQSLLNNQLTTGENALTQVQTTYNNLLNESLSSSEFGLGALAQGLQLQIQSDSQISQSLNALFGEIARGFGTAMGGSGGGAGGGASGTVGGKAGSLVQTGTNLYNDLFGGTSGTGIDPGWGSGANANQAVTDALGNVAPLAARELLPELFPAAPAAAPPVAAALAPVAPAAAAPTAAAPAATGSLAGGAIGLGILAAPAIAGMMTPAVSLDRAYWQKLGDNLNSNDANTAAGALYELLANAPNGQVPPEMQARVAALQGGLLNQMYAADPNYQGRRQISTRKGTQIQ
jgi:hypothetical protein